MATFAIAGGGAWLAMRDSIHESVDEDLHARLRLLEDELNRTVNAGGVEHIGDRSGESADDRRGGAIPTVGRHQVGLSVAWRGKVGHRGCCSVSRAAPRSRANSGRGRPAGPCADSPHVICRHALDY